MSEAADQGAKRDGGCLCSAVRFTVSQPGNFGACHCSQCQKWTGGVFLGLTVAEDAMVVTAGAGRIAGYRSSGWATRYHCATCGSPLWYRYDRGVDGAGEYEVALGLLDNAEGFELRREIFIDRKPGSFALAGDHERLTKQETLARYGAQVDGA